MYSLKTLNMEKKTNTLSCFKIAFGYILWKTGCFFGSLIHSYNELEITAQKAITKCRKVRYPIYLSQIRFAPFYSKRKKTAGSSLFILSSLGFQVRDDSAPLSWMAHQQQWIRTEMSPTQARTSLKIPLCELMHNGNDLGNGTATWPHFLSFQTKISSSLKFVAFSQI